jgi:hypothetical protein
VCVCASVCVCVCVRACASAAHLVIGVLQSGAVDLKDGRHIKAVGVGRQVKDLGCLAPVVWREQRVRREGEREGERRGAKGRDGEMGLGKK